ncbi:hypothetical protein GCM10019016_130360 [Streptomyces prasinosporus]|uniref:Uncharacterized protein n=1 Tax=Streptomyces prasinosporus TaxID=68256 RepID=A0ABP6UE77_9ACTN
MPEQGEEAGLLLLRELVPADQVDALLREGGGDVLVVAGGVPGHQLAGAGPDHLQHLARLEAGGGAGGHAGGYAPLEAGHPDHEELVQVAGEDREEVRPLQQRGLGILGQFEHPLVERQPTALAVEETALRQRGGAVGERLLVAVQVGVDVGFQIGHRSGHGVRPVRGDGAHGGLRVLDLCRGVGLAHDPIVPRRGRHGRVGMRGWERWWP